MHLWDVGVHSYLPSIIVTSLVVFFNAIDCTFCAFLTRLLLQPLK
jgi:hypothetical protein